jgi:CHAT domain-containing protein
VVADGRARFVELGDYATVTEAQRRLLAALTALSGRGMSDRLLTAVSRSLRSEVDLLDTLLLAPIRPLLGDRALVVVPTRTLTTLPWPLLPSLAGRPVSVAPSATVWHTARLARRSGPVAHRPPLLVAGPRLAHAAGEIHAIAGQYPGAGVLTGADASVAGTLDGLDGAPLAHLATHGHHNAANVLFSRLELADGPLMAHDLDRIARAPGLVVLSACDVGRMTVRPGDEVLGFTAALLHAGTPTVIASVAPVPDEQTVSVMVRLHRAMAAGASPAAALATASRADPYASFCCFGDG